MGVAFTASAVGRVLGAAAPSTEIAEWAVIPDEYPAMTPSTASLERVVATTTDGRRISVFAKTLQSIRHSPAFETIPDAFREAAVAGSPCILKLTSTPRGSLPTCPTACGRRGSFSSRSSATTGPGCGSRTWRPLRLRGISPGTRSRPAPSDASPAGSLPPAFPPSYRPSAWASGRSSVCGSRAPSSHHSEVTRPGATRSCGLRWPPTVFAPTPCTGRRRAAALDVRTGYVGSLLLRSGFTGPPLELLAAVRRAGHRGPVRPESSIHAVLARPGGRSASRPDHGQPVAVTPGPGRRALSRHGLFVGCANSGGPAR